MTTCRSADPALQQDDSGLRPILTATQCTATQANTTRQHATPGLTQLQHLQSMYHTQPSPAARAGGSPQPPAHSPQQRPCPHLAWHSPAARQRPQLLQRVLLSLQAPASKAVRHHLQHQHPRTHARVIVAVQSQAEAAALQGNLHYTGSAGLAADFPWPCWNEALENPRRAVDNSLLNKHTHLGHQFQQVLVLPR